MKQESNPGLLLMAPSPGFSGRGVGPRQKVNSPFSALLHIDSCSSLEAAFKEKSEALTSPISGCHEGFFYQMQRGSTEKALSFSSMFFSYDFSRKNEHKDLFHMSLLSCVLNFELRLVMAHFQKYIIQYLTSVICLKP